MTSPAPRLAVSGRYAGPASRLASFALDAVIVTVGFAMAAGIVSYLVGLLTPWTIGDEDGRSLGWIISLVAFTFSYAFISLAAVGRTPGKALVGLRVVQRPGTPLKARSAFVRTVTEPLSFLFFGLGLVGIVVGREHRALHDVLGGTAVIYDWGDRPAELPAPLTRWVEHQASDVMDPLPGPTHMA